MERGGAATFDVSRFTFHDTPIYMAYWLLKTEPEEYSWEQLEADKRTAWTGIRNFQARNNLREMKVGDLAFVYHSGDDKAIVGIAKIVREAYEDPTAETGDWAAVDVEAVMPVGRLLGLEEIRNTHNLAVMPVVTQARLSVHPVTESQWKDVLRYTKTTL